jgi:hypothetical protein
MSIRANNRGPAISCKRGFAVACCLTPFLLVAQTNVHGGDGSVNVGTNNGQITVKKFDMSPQVKKELERLSRINGSSSNGWQGVLFPGTAPTDSSVCERLIAKGESEQTNLVPSGWLDGLKDAIENGYVIRLGGLIAFCKSLPCDIISVDHQNVVSLIPIGKSVGLRAELCGDDGKTFASIDGNTIHMNQHVVWYFSRPNHHTLSVIDQENTETLWVSLENPRYVRLRAKFGDRNKNISFEITDKDIHTRLYKWGEIHQRYPGCLRVYPRQPGDAWRTGPGQLRIRRDL